MSTLSKIHMTSEELRTSASEKTVEVLSAIKSELSSIQNAFNAPDLTPILAISKEKKAKLEEIKSAILATNLQLKRLEKKLDFAETNKLLSQLLEEIKKPCNVTLDLQ